MWCWIISTFFHDHNLSVAIRHPRHTSLARVVAVKSGKINRLMRRRDILVAWRFELTLEQQQQKPCTRTRYLVQHTATSWATVSLFLSSFKHVEGPTSVEAGGWACYFVCEDLGLKTSELLEVRWTDGNPVTRIKLLRPPCRKSVNLCYDVPRARRPAQAHSGHGSEDENLAPNANTKNSE